MNPIRSAVEVVQQRGWAKGTSEARDGSVCIGGAIAMVICGNPNDWGSNPEARTQFSELLELVGAVAEEQYPERCDEVLGYGTESSYHRNAQTFNNHPITTLEELLRVCDKAAVRFDELV